MDNSSKNVSRIIGNTIDVPFPWCDNEIVKNGNSKTSSSQLFDLRAIEHNADE